MSYPLPSLPRIPPEIVALTDYEPLAREHLGEQAWAYFTSGAADEVTLRDNREAYDRLKLLPRVLRDMKGGNTQVTLLGETLEYPIMLAPIAYQRMAHKDGELATVLGASAMKAGVVVSTRASVRIEDIAAAAQTRLWFQLYMQPDREFTRDLVRRAEEAGYQALVLTVDAPLNGIRNGLQRVQFRLPPGVEAVNLRGMAQPDTRPRLAGEKVAFGALLDDAPTWKDIEWLLSQTRLPVILKGILSPEDAELAIQLGFAGLIVSNHGGRILDTVPASIDVLPQITAVVAGRVPVLVDGGIRRGTDVLKAIALGASAVLVGRPYIFGLSVAGAVGVAHVLNILKAEFEVAMGLTGCATVAEIQREVIWQH
ncbi:4-hydroxymandelate oxidase [Prosthecobacter fusiformis]|uniref:4-hydroxymandelate oxidase n=1 Tax=Prosthecobacter fusiformis TaxID=48464 RepID=A0A4R7S2D6_9BACT|nr:alpha-hydroxy acid oxidase [Prosthecobacter fusiformis]TDU71167.1 4-hydroxymandelate oxidase [Prosthecobacter fusiformis]